MIPFLRRLARRLRPADDARGKRFVAAVRGRLEPLLTDAGFVLDPGDPSASGDRSTVVRYHTEPGPFTDRHPGTAGHLRVEGSPLELRIAQDARGRVHVAFEDWDLSALLTVVRAGPGAPPRRRRRDDPGAVAASPEAAIAHVEDLLRRLLDAASAR